MTDTTLCPPFPKKLFFCLLGLVFFIVPEAHARQTVIEIAVTNPVQDRPVAGALVQLLLGSEVLASGATNAQGIAEITFIPTDTETAPELPQALRLSAWPNPAVNTLTVEIQNPAAQAVTLSAYSLLGQRIGSSTHNLTPGVYRTTLSLGAMATQPVLLVMQSPAGSYSAMVTYTGSRGSVSIPAPQFSHPPAAQTETSQQAQLQTVFYTISITKPGYENRSQLVGISDGQQHVNLHAQLNPKNPVLGIPAQHFGGDKGQEVCYSYDDVAEVVSRSSIDDIDFVISVVSDSPALSVNQSLDDICFVSSGPGVHPFSISALTSVGGEATAIYSFETTPLIEVHVQNNETHSFTPGTLAYLVTLDVDGSPVDSLTSSTGEFLVPVRGDGRFRTGLLRDGEFFSFVRHDQHNGSSDSPPYISRVVDWAVRDKHGVTVGELTPGAYLADSPEGWYNWVAELAINNRPVINRWNSTGPPVDPDLMFYYAFSENGVGPDEIKIAKSLFSPATGETFVMHQHILEIILEEFDTLKDWFPPGLLPPLNIYEHLEFSASNNQHMNEPIIFGFTDGIVAVYGRPHDTPEGRVNVVKHALIGMINREEGSLSEALVRRIFHHEIVPGIFFNNTRPSDCCTTIYQSVTHNVGQFGAQVMTNLDGKVHRLFYEPTFLRPNTPVSDIISLPPGYLQGSQESGVLNSSDRIEGGSYGSVLLDGAGAPVQPPEAPYRSKEGLHLINPPGRILDSSGGYFSPASSDVSSGSSSSSDPSQIRLLNPLFKRSDGRYSSLLLDSSGKPVYTEELLKSVYDTPSAVIPVELPPSDGTNVPRYTHLSLVA